MGREDISFYEVGIHHTTYSGAGLTASMTGYAVTVVAPGTVGVGSTGQVLLGGVTSYESDGKVSVQDRGYVELTAATKIPQLTNVTVNGTGGVVAGSEVALPIVVDNTDWASTGKVTVFLR